MLIYFLLERFCKRDGRKNKCFIRILFKLFLIFFFYQVYNFIECTFLLKILYSYDLQRMCQRESDNIYFPLSLISPLRNLTNFQNFHCSRPRGVGVNCSKFDCSTKSRIAWKGLNFIDIPQKSNVRNVVEVCGTLWAISGGSANKNIWKSFRPSLLLHV